MVGNWSFDADNLHIKWFEDGALNVAANCIDRHLETRGSQTAIIWEGDDPAESKHVTLSPVAPRSLPLRQCSGKRAA